MNVWDPKANEIFLEALACDSPENRNAYLDEACGADTRLRDEVDSLLEADDQAGNFLDSPASDLGAAAEMFPVAEGPGTTIGRYKLMEQIGEGGMGLVYVAEQQEPVQRKVALKIIKLGMDTREVVARFEAERQALALMDHANIARVLEAGATESGRPYFVMELVRGIPITDYCDQAKLATHQRLKLFVSVCQAIQHAHQKGIIHRDVKPGNVLVTLRDGTPVPKVIDFGVAKAINQRLTERTVYTRFAQMVGTPLYMSPEQAQNSELDVDTRSDVYSLGVLLYELLSGSTPFDAKELQRVGYDEICRIIRETDPPTPSKRLSTLGDTITEVSQHRQAQPSALRRLLRGDLDWIVMKALEKDRTRRYETANDFAADVHRYLNNEAVEARHPSATYTFGRFARRNRTILTTAALVAVALLIGTVVSVLLAISATIERNKAEDASQREFVARRRAEDASQRESAARRRSEDLRYSADMSRAMQALRDRDWGLVRRLLRSHHPSADGIDRRGWEWRYLWRACWERNRTPSLHHDGFVQAFAISPDGRTLVSGETKGTLSVWDVPTHRLLDSRKAHRGYVWNVEFSPDGNMLATGGADSDIRLWGLDPDNRTLTEVATLPAGAEANCVAFSHDGKLVASGGLETAIRLWDVRGQEMVHELPIPNWRAMALAFHPDGEALAAHCLNEVVIWKLPYNQDEPPLEIPGYDITFGWTGLAFSPNGLTIAASWKNDGVQLCSVADGKPLRQLVSDPPAVASCVAFSPDGSKIAIGDHDKNVTVWDTGDGKELVKLRGHHSSIVCGVRFTPDGKTLASSSVDKTIRLWRLDRAENVDARPDPLVRHAGPVRKVAFSTDGKWVVTAGIEGRVVLLEAKTWRKVREFSSTGFAVSDDSSLLAIQETERVQLFDLARPMRLLHSIPIPAFGWLSRVAFSPKGHLAAIDGDSLQLLHPRKPTRPVAVYAQADELSPHRFCLMAFSPDGETLAVDDWRGDLALLDGRTLKVLDHKQEELARGAWQVVFSPDGHYLVATCLHHTVKVWDVRNRRLEAYCTLDDHTDSALSASFSEQGVLAVGCANGQVKLWDTVTWAERATLKCHEGDRGVDAIDFSPDGDILVTGGADGTVRIHRAATPEEVIEAERKGDDPLSGD